MAHQKMIQKKEETAFSLEWPNGQHLEKKSTIGSLSNSSRAERKARELAANI